ncbi:MAG: dNTP triphosphohydrolase [Pirellulales bacterium]
MSSFVSIADRESGLLASYASHSDASRGRIHLEEPHPFRGPYQRDRDRIIHSGAFRRLGQKTQVFTGHELGDYHRTRLTHTFEATSIARTIGRALRLNEDLVEALTLMHDLGHPPYGHAGEDALDECLHDRGGFDHNSQALRIVEILEQRSPRHPGLNLTRETLEGQWARCVKKSLPYSPSLEVQVVEASDSLTYDSHDPDDALHYRLLTLADLHDVPFWRAATQRVRARDAGLTEFELRRATVHELIDWQVTDVIDQTATNLVLHGIETPEELRPRRSWPNRVPNCATTNASWNASFTNASTARRNCWRRVDCCKTNSRRCSPRIAPRRTICPACTARFDDQGVERSVGDYLAGMTDRFAEQEHERLFPND